MENLNEEELKKAINDGFIHDFIFLDDKLHSAISPERSYYLKDVIIKPKYCSINNHIVYRIIAPDGVKGTAISIPSDHPNDF